MHGSIMVRHLGILPSYFHAWKTNGAANDGLLETERDDSPDLI